MSSCSKNKLMTRSGCRDGNSSRAVPRNKFMIRPSCVEDSLELLTKVVAKQTRMQPRDNLRGDARTARDPTSRALQKQERRLQSGNNVTAKIQSAASAR